MTLLQLPACMKAPEWSTVVMTGKDIGPEKGFVKVIVMHQAETSYLKLACFREPRFPLIQTQSAFTRLPN